MSDDRSNAGGSLGCVVVLYGMLQLWAGYLGIEHHLGGGWAIAAILVALVLGFSLPLTVGAFLGALDVWQWHWIGALIFAAPGLAFMALTIPWNLAAAMRKNSTVTEQSSQRHSSFKHAEYRSSPAPTEPLRHSSAAAPALPAPHKGKAEALPPEVSVDGYALVARELEQGKYDDALWLKCLSEADGDEVKAGARYNRERAKALLETSHLRSQLEREREKARVLLERVNNARKAAALPPPPRDYSDRPIEATRPEQKVTRRSRFP